MTTVKRAKAYPSFLVVAKSYSDGEGHYVVKAANLQAAAKDAAERLKNNDIENYDTWDLEEHPENYSVVIYTLADEGQEYIIRSAGIVLEEAGA